MRGHDAILARDVEAHFGRAASIEERVAEELGTDCGVELESGDTRCDDLVRRRPVCDECCRAAAIAADVKAYAEHDDQAALRRIHAYMDARDARRAKRARLERALTDGWRS